MSLILANHSTECGINRMPLPCILEHTSHSIFTPLDNDATLTDAGTKMLSASYEFIND